MVTELMKQPQYQPLQVWEMALTLFAVNNGYFDDIDVKKALAAERSMRDYLKSKYADLVKRIEDKKDLAGDDEKALKDAIEDWKKNGTLLRLARRANARHQGNTDQDQECAEHPEDHQGHGDGRRLQDAQGAGAHAHGAPLRREDPQRRRAHQPRQSRVPPPVPGGARHA